MNNNITIGNAQKGDKTHHQDQLIIPINFKEINISPNAPNVLIPFVLFELVIVIIF